jgi:hypothetical protein
MDFNVVAVDIYGGKEKKENENAEGSLFLQQNCPGTITWTVSSFQHFSYPHNHTPNFN